MQPQSTCTKGVLAKELHISNTTIHKYCEVAIIHADFRGDYPLINGSTGAVNSRAPLTAYQCWFIRHLVVLVNDAARYSKAHIKADFEAQGKLSGVYMQVSKKEFEQEQANKIDLASFVKPKAIATIKNGHP